MTHQIIFAGFGGQGIMCMGQLLAYAAMQEGKSVTWMPSYGPEMRGGTSNCHVIISDETVASPIATEVTAVMAMNRPSLDKFENCILPGGLLMVNSSLAGRTAARDDINLCYIPVNEIAQKLGNSRVANMVMLGGYVAKTGVVPLDSLVKSLRKAFVMRPNKAHMIPINREALQRGADFVSRS